MKKSTDRVPTLLTPGEAVLNVAAARILGKNAIDRLNRAGIRMMQEGGMVEEENPYPAMMQYGGIVRSMRWGGGNLPNLARRMQEGGIVPSIEISGSGPIRGAGFGGRMFDPEAYGDLSISRALNLPDYVGTSPNVADNPQAEIPQNNAINLALPGLANEGPIGGGSVGYPGGFGGFGSPGAASFAGPGFAAGTGIAGQGGFGTNFGSLGFGAFGGGGPSGWGKMLQF
jgi:hypothetical protein